MFVAYCKIYKLGSRFEIEKAKINLVRKLFLYPALLIREIAPITALMILIEFTNVEISALYSMIAFCLYALHGFTNAVIYGFTVGIIKIIEYYMASCTNLHNYQSDKQRLESCEGPNLLYSSFHGSVINN